MGHRGRRSNNISLFFQFIKFRRNFQIKLWNIQTSHEFGRPNQINIKGLFFKFKDNISNINISLRNQKQRLYSFPNIKFAGVNRINFSTQNKKIIPRVHSIQGYFSSRVQNIEFMKIHGSMEYKDVFKIQGCLMNKNGQSALFQNSKWFDYGNTRNSNALLFPVYCALLGKFIYSYN